MACVDVDKIEEAWTGRLLKEEWNLFVTFTFKNEISFEHIHGVYGRFAVNLRKHVYGKNSKKRVPMFPVIEGELPDDTMFLERRHIHVLLNLQSSIAQSRELLRELWMAASTHCGDPDVACSEQDKDGWCLAIFTKAYRRNRVSYILKQAKFNSDRIMNYYTQASLTSAAKD